MNHRTRLAGFLLLATLVVMGQGCGTPNAAPPGASKPVTLTYWRVLDDGDAFDQIIQGYRALHPNVSINYRKLRLDEYERELVNALAEDRGPDIISLHNTWVRSYQAKLLPGMSVREQAQAIGTARTAQIAALAAPSAREFSSAST